MKKLTKRNDKRRALKTPITHSMYNKSNHSKLFPIAYYDNCHAGMIGNISSGGMSFESDIPCWENGPIYVNLCGDSMGLMVSEETETLSGTVVWCNENTSKRPHFRVGVKFDAQQEIDNKFLGEFGTLWLS